MENSDSDTDNECYESAEEIIDEEEIHDVNTEFKSSELESESNSSEPVGPVSDTVSLSHELHENVSGNTMSYRKRPERVKRSHSISTKENISKSPDELTPKTDKIMSDVFLQDITSKLSKNINRSLNTLQQTTSNVKELILNSIPVSSSNNNEGFSYDDRNLFSTAVNTFESHDQSESTRNIEDKSEKGLQSHNKKLPAEEVHYSSGDVQRVDVEDGEQSSTRITNPEPKLSKVKEEEEAKILGDSKQSDCNIAEEENIRNINNVSLNSACLNEADNEASKDEVRSVTQPENSDNIKAEFTERREFDIVGANNQNSGSKDNSLTVLKEYSENKNSQNVIGNVNNEESDELTLDDEDIPKVTPIKEELASHTTFNDSSNECDILTNLKENDENNKYSEVDAKRDSSSSLHEEQPKSNSDCNLKELKQALKNIIKEDNNKLENAEENFSKNFEKAKLCSDNEVVEDNSFKEGWDDFDFSDVEDESSCKLDYISSTDLTAKENPSNQKGKIRVESSNVNSACKKINEEDKSGDHALLLGNQKISSPIKSLPTDFNISNDKNSKSTGDEMAKKIKENVNEGVIESKPVTEDAWDWDTWEETDEENKETDNAKSKNSKAEKSEDDFSHLSKWSGWDNFGQKSEEKSKNWGLGSWGVDMLLNKATVVTQGISNVLEAQLGAPDPMTLAKIDKIEEENLMNQSKNEINVEEPTLEVSKKNSLTGVNLFPVSGLTNLVAEVTSKIVEHSKIQEIGSKVITGGLDTLETFGKKTMEVLQEGDPGLKNKRALLSGGEKPVISQLLREAREKADREQKKMEERESAKKCHFETLFDDFQGLVHLEALEMLSTQYELKLEQLRSEMSSEEQEDLNSVLEEVEQLCSLDEIDMEFRAFSDKDFEGKLKSAIEPLKNEISIQKIIQVHEEVCSWLQKSTEAKPSLRLMNQKFVSTLAELAAATIQQFHKSGELLSVKECRKTVEEVDVLLRFTNMLCMEIDKLCEKFILHSKKIHSEGGSNEALTSFSENVTIVMTNSTSYVRQAFNLLIPVLQFGAAVY